MRVLKSLMFVAAIQAIAGIAGTSAQAAPQCTLDDVQILQITPQRIAYAAGLINVLGEVKNNCASTIGTIYIGLAFRDSAGKLVAAATLFCSQTRTKPGETCAFSWPVEVESYAKVEAKVTAIMPHS